VFAEVLTDCAQLVKANSIEGNKQKVKVCYTQWTNLHKKGGMDTGQIGFHDEKAVCILSPAIQVFHHLDRRPSVLCCAVVLRTVCSVEVCGSVDA
jgi:hypothetical protein